MKMTEGKCSAPSPSVEPAAPHSKVARNLASFFRETAVGIPTGGVRLRHMGNSADAKMRRRHADTLLKLHER
jgi:hypothetical protein